MRAGSSLHPSKTKSPARSAHPTLIVASKEPLRLCPNLVVWANVRSEARCQRIRLNTRRVLGSIVNTIMDVFLEPSDALAHRACDLRDPLSSKEKHDDQQNHQEMRKSQIFKHGGLTSNKCE